jgi:hypothetical protein
LYSKGEISFTALECGIWFYGDLSRGEYVSKLLDGFAGFGLMSSKVKRSLTFISIKIAEQTVDFHSATASPRLSTPKFENISCRQ